MVLRVLENLKTAPLLQHQITNEPKATHYKLLNFNFKKIVRIKI
ncbi:hypothetical protein Q5W90_04355 [Borreliella burgdorferi]|nr:hypothetical protein [Borreliella burgdorferi]MDO7256698.1 hypothetical protein [Borreliella burgdorferi]MDO7279416.1 hypothetical protein [Borreliella burgdorferi]